MHPPILRSTLIVALAAATIAPAVRAHCGAALCTLDTSPEAHGVPSEPGLRVDLRFEYIDQDQPRAGRRKVTVGEIARDHDEIRTLNRNVTATFDYTSNADWGASVQVPFVKRDHSHFDNDTGAPVLETWQFQKLGDVRVLGRRRLAGGEVTHGVIGGIKLPTGDTEIKNDAGENAERSLQPGSGTTAAILGYYTHTTSLIGAVPTRLHAQAQVQAPVNASKGFRPGAAYSADVGVAYPVTASVNVLAQINLSIRNRDRGEAAEPEDTGGSFIWLSPGVSYALSKSAQVYGFVQLPLYQRVNGVQLTADTATSVGVRWRF